MKAISIKKHEITFVLFINKEYFIKKKYNYYFILEKAILKGIMQKN